KRVSFFEYLPKHTTIWMDDPGAIFHRIDEIYDKTDFENEKDNTIVKKEVIVDSKDLTKDIQNLNKVEFGNLFFSSPEKTFMFNTSPQPVFNKNFELLAREIRERQ